jgi:hypothetical protein
MQAESESIQLDDHSLGLFRFGLGLLALIKVLVQANYPVFWPEQWLQISRQQPIAIRMQPGRCTGW